MSVRFGMIQTESVSWKCRMTFVKLFCYWFLGYFRLHCARMSHFAMASAGVQPGWTFRISELQGKNYSSQLSTFTSYFSAHSLFMNVFTFLQEFPSHILDWNPNIIKHPCPSEKTWAIFKSSYFSEDYSIFQEQLSITELWKLTLQAVDQLNWASCCEFLCCPPIG